jgi:hypothetical protein
MYFVMRKIMFGGDDDDDDGGPVNYRSDDEV